MSKEWEISLLSDFCSLQAQTTCKLQTMVSFLITSASLSNLPQTERCSKLLDRWVERYYQAWRAVVFTSQLSRSRYCWLLQLTWKQILIIYMHNAHRGQMSAGDSGVFGQCERVEHRNSRVWVCVTWSIYICVLTHSMFWSSSWRCMLYVASFQLFLRIFYVEVLKWHLSFVSHASCWKTVW